MLGPRPVDFWTPPPTPFGHLQPGRHYRVSQMFVDYDDHTHPVGETWLYLGHNFLPYEDGLSLFVSTEEGQAWHIRMQWQEEEQGLILDKFEDYVAEVESLAV